MNKSYFEMNDAEKQLYLMSSNIDYAICIFSEGLPIHQDKETTREIITLQNNITNNLLNVSADIGELLKIAIKEDKL